VSRDLEDEAGQLAPNQLGNLHWQLLLLLEPDGDCGAVAASLFEWEAHELIELDLGDWRFEVFGVRRGDDLVRGDWFSNTVSGKQQAVDIEVDRCDVRVDHSREHRIVFGASAEDRAPTVGRVEKNVAVTNPEAGGGAAIVRIFVPSVKRMSNSELTSSRVRSSIFSIPGMPSRRCRSMVCASRCVAQYEPRCAFSAMPSCRSRREQERCRTARSAQRRPEAAGQGVERERPSRGTDRHHRAAAPHQQEPHHPRNQWPYSACFAVAHGTGLPRRARS